MVKRARYIRDGRAPIPLKESTSRVMSANKAKDTKPELLLRKALYQAGVRGYRLHVKEITGRPDMVFTKHQLAIFIHGCFWHRCPHCRLPIPKSNTDFWMAKFARNTERDRQKEQALLQSGWQVVTAWECAIKANTGKVVRELKRYINI